MIDFILLCYFLYGLFYAGTMFDKICEYIIQDDKHIDRYDSTIVLVLIVLCILLYPFVIGVNSINKNDSE